MAEEAKTEKKELSMGGAGSAPEISRGMRKYQKAKQQARKAKKAGDEDGVAIAMVTMAYWETHMIAHGAISVKQAALPDGVVPEGYEERRRAAQTELQDMKKHFKKSLKSK